MADEDEAAEVRQIWSALGLPGVFDVHTHFMPKSVMDKVWDYFDSAGPLVGREWPITYRAAESQRVEMLRQFGVRGFTALVYPHKPQMAAWLNQWALQFSRSTSDCLATATFYPEQDAADYVEAAIHDGTQVFKAHVQVGRYEPNDVVKGKVTKLTNFGVFVELEPGLEGLLHISELADHKVENPEQIVKVGDQIEVKILRVDTADRKIGLSRKLNATDEDEAGAAGDAAAPGGPSAPAAPREELKGGRDGGSSGPLFTMDQSET